MNNKLKQISFLLWAATFVAACTQDELTGDSNVLPEGRYPVEIASVSIGGEVGVQPWGADAPQTRAEDAEYEGKIRTLWQEGDIFYTKFKDGDGIGSYTVTGIGGIDRDRTLYWRSTTQEETLVSWFTQPSLDADGGMLDISNQSERLAYVCRKEQPVKYGEGDITVVLEHQLAKVRVYVQGTGYEGNAESVSINGVPTTCTVVDGVPTAPGETGTITMHPTTLNNAACFEANLLPDTAVGGEKAFTVSFESEDSITLDVEEFKVDRGKIYTVNLRLQKSGTTVIDLSEGKEVNISGGGNYFIHGAGSKGIKVTGSGNPTIYLANVSLDVADDNAINLQSNATLVIQGNDTIKSSNGAGIFVASGKTVTIQSSDYADNALFVQAGGEAAGIGGYANTDCGNITIQKIRLYAYGSSAENGGACPGIGGAGTGTCGTIKIENSVVYAYGSASSDNHAPAIGSAHPAIGDSPDAPKCEINGGTINAYRGYTNNTTSYADYIGQGGNADNQHGSANDGINLGNGSCRSCTIYGWTDNQYKTISYDNNGNRI